MEKLESSFRVKKFVQENHGEVQVIQTGICGTCRTDFSEICMTWGYETGPCWGSLRRSASQGPAQVLTARSFVQEKAGPTDQEHSPLVSTISTKAQLYPSLPVVAQRKQVMEAYDQAIPE